MFIENTSIQLQRSEQSKMDSSPDTQEAIEERQHIKRPMNSFMIWSREQRYEILRHNPGMSNAVISKTLGAMWRLLNEEQKRPYIEKAKKLDELHKIEYPDYKYRPKRRKQKSKKPSTSSETHSIKTEVDKSEDSIPASSSYNHQATSKSSVSRTPVTPSPFSFPSPIPAPTDYLQSNHGRGLYYMHPPRPDFHPNLLDKHLLRDKYMDQSLDKLSSYPFFGYYSPIVLRRSSCPCCLNSGPESNRHSHFPSTHLPAIDHGLHRSIHNEHYRWLYSSTANI